MNVPVGGISPDEQETVEHRLSNSEVCKEHRAGQDPSDPIWEDGCSER